MGDTSASPPERNKNNPLYEAIHYVRPSASSSAKFWSYNVGLAPLLLLLGKLPRQLVPCENEKADSSDSQNFI